MAALEHAYSYLTPSFLQPVGDVTELMLSTSGGVTESGPREHPFLFSGFLREPEPARSALLICGRVARTRFYVHPSMVAAIIRASDPVVTSNVDRLRFEAFSLCCGVYARFDILHDGLSRAPETSGSTNVDFNPSVREALSQMTGRQPLRLEIGADVEVRSFGVKAVAEKVALPERWLRGFAEVHLAASELKRVAVLSSIDARRFLASLPRTSKSPLWALPSGKTLRLSSQHVSPAARIAGVERLHILKPLLPLATELTVYGADTQAPHAEASAWQLSIPGGRFTVVLSPELSRGFSGEGGVLYHLSDEKAADDASGLTDLLGWDPYITVGELSIRSRLSKERVQKAVTVLGVAGRIGYDLATEAYFHRELPFETAGFESMNPRLRSARALVETGSVILASDGARVISGDSAYMVSLSEHGDRCTCPWFGKHHGTRGPCKHILASRLAHDQAA